MCKRKYNKFCFAYLCQPFKLHHRTSNWIRVFGSIERDNKLTYFMFIRFVARNVLHFVKREATLASRESLFFTSSLTTYAIYTKKIVVNSYISWLLESYILTCISKDSLVLVYIYIYIRSVSDAGSEISKIGQCLPVLYYYKYLPLGKEHWCTHFFYIFL